MAAGSIDETVLRKIPAKYHDMISALTIVRDVSFCGKQSTAYDVTLSRGVATNDGDVRFTAFSINGLKDFFKYNVKSTAETTGPAEPIEIIPAEDTGTVVTDAAIISRHLKQLCDAVNTQKKSFIVIGCELYWFKSTQAYLTMDYPNIEEFAKDMYGIKKAMAYQYIGIAEAFGKRDKNGFISGLDDRYRDYGVTQLIAMRGMDEDTRMRCAPGMKVSEMKKLASGSTADQTATQDADISGIREFDRMMSERHGNPCNGSKGDVSVESGTAPDESGKSNTGGSSRKTTQELYNISDGSELVKRQNEIIRALEKVLLSYDGVSISIRMVL